MGDNNFEIVNSENIYQLSDDDQDNLKYYLEQQNQSFIDLTNDQEDTSVDFYLKKMFMENSQPLVDIYQYHHHYRYDHPYVDQVHEEPIRSLSDNNDNTFALEIATCGMPKDTKLPVPYENFSLTDGCFGDDAGFIAQTAQENFLGISDGAGGNLMLGYDPRLFSECLMRNCSDLVYAGKHSTSEPKRLLCDAFDRVQTENCFGSATACVLGFDCQAGRLYSVNIGDSGYIIIRQGCVVYRSQSQKKNGDCPRQLDVYPWTISLKEQGVNYTEISSLDAICQEFDLESDDIIILSTDGLFDNVPNHLIEQILSQHHSLTHAANELVNRAVKFYIKPDDILVIMARVITNNNSVYEQ